MTDADRFVFDQAFRAVVRVHGGRDWSEQAITKLRGDYWAALEEIPIEAITRASTELVRTATRWPKPIDWRTAIMKTAEPILRPSAPVVEENGVLSVTYHCLRCEDTGWRPACGCDTGRLERRRCPQHSPPEPEIPAQPDPETRRHHRNKYVFLPHAPMKAMPLTACECRTRNPLYQHNHQSRLVQDAL